MKPIHIVHRTKPFQFAYIDSKDALRNWAIGHPNFSEYRFYEAERDRFIKVPVYKDINIQNKAQKLIGVVERHFKQRK